MSITHMRPRMPRLLAALSLAAPPMYLLTMFIRPNSPPAIISTQQQDTGACGVLLTVTLTSGIGTMQHH